MTDGEVYELIYFLDEGFSHYLQFVPLFFVMGWFIIHDRPGRTANPTIALFLGVVHGIERGVGIIEGEKWFLGPAVIVWMAIAGWLRWRRVGSTVAGEFFFRHAVAFCVTLPVSQIVYYIWFDSFPPPSSERQRSATDGDRRRRTDRRRHGSGGRTRKMVARPQVSPVTP